MNSSLSLNSDSPEETLKIGETIGNNLRGGEVIELISDLGGGKTTLTKGIAEGAGSKDNVHSPSFTIENEYTAKDLIIHHLDFYRLSNPGIMKDELIERLSDHRAVVVIEWADIVEDVLPRQRLVINFKTKSETARELQLNYAEQLEYLVNGLK